MVNENHNLDNTMTMYLDYIRDNQRLYRYIVENSSENERTLSNLVERQYYNNRNRIRRSISYDRNNRYSPNNIRPRDWNISNTQSSQTFTPFVPQNFLSPVSITPTQEQISVATTNMYFSDISQNERMFTSCPITLMDFSNNSIITRINNCRHYFSEEGIRRHFLNSVRCPYCRYDIRNSLGTGPMQNNTFNQRSVNYQLKKYSKVTSKYTSSFKTKNPV